jgi:hypothetical protein
MKRAGTRLGDCQTSRAGTQLGGQRQCFATRLTEHKTARNRARFKSELRLAPKAGHQ